MSSCPPEPDPTPITEGPVVEAPSAGASLLFGDRFPLAQAYVDLLCAEGIEWGLIGPREGARIWSRHVAHCAVLAASLPHGARVVDVGSGAGLPGLPLAILRPDLTVTLLEPLARRTRFLDYAIERLTPLGLAGVEVLQSKAERAPRGRWDVVTSRAVAPLVTLAQWSLPLLADGGQWWAIRGASAQHEILASEEAIRAAGGHDLTVHTLEAEGIESLTVVYARYVQTPSADVSRETKSSGPRRRNR